MTDGQVKGGKVEPGNGRNFFYQRRNRFPRQSRVVHGFGGKDQHPCRRGICRIKFKYFKRGIPGFEKIAVPHGLLHFVDQRFNLFNGGRIEFIIPLPVENFRQISRFAAPEDHAVFVHEKCHGKEHDRVSHEFRSKFSGGVHPDAETGIGVTAVEIFGIFALIGGNDADKELILMLAAEIFQKGKDAVAILGAGVHENDRPVFGKVTVLVFIQFAKRHGGTIHPLKFVFALPRNIPRHGGKKGGREGYCQKKKKVFVHIKKLRIVEITFFEDF